MEGSEEQVSHSATVPSPRIVCHLPREARLMRISQVLSCAPFSRNRYAACMRMPSDLLACAFGASHRPPRSGDMRVLVRLCGVRTWRHQMRYRWRARSIAR
jgi:hypothetical protein